LKSGVKESQQNMDFKIDLPNPFEGTPEEFFSQMRIVLKACEKSYQEMVKNLTDEQKEEMSKWLYIAFRHPTLEDAMDEADPDMAERQKIQLGVFQV
jgi:hypothetical protein